MPLFVILFEAYTRGLNGNYFADSVAENISAQRITSCLTIDAFKIEFFEVRLISY